MKRCPQCNREYADDTLRFCLEDGTSLVALRTRVEPPPTEILPAQSRLTDRSSEPTLPAYPATVRVQPNESRRSNSFLIAGVIAIVGMGLMLIVSSIQNTHALYELERLPALPPRGTPKAQEGFIATIPMN